MDKAERAKIFQSWTKKLPLSVEDLEKNFLKRYEETRPMYPRLKDVEIEEFVWDVFQGEMANQLSSKAPKFEGVLLSVIPSYDPNKKLVEKAIQAGSINKDGKPVFNPSKGIGFDWQDPNNKPYDVNKAREIKPETQKIYFMLASVLDEADKPGEYKKAAMYLKGEAFKDTADPIMKKVVFRANASDEKLKSEIMQLNASDGVTKFKVVDENPNLKDLAIKHLKKNIYNLSSFWEFKSEKGGFGFFITRGIVVRKQMGKGRKNVLEITSFGEGATNDLKNVIAFVDNNVPIDYIVPGCLIYICGTSYQSAEGDYRISANSIWADPKYLPTTPEPTSSEAVAPTPQPQMAQEPKKEEKVWNDDIKVDVVSQPVSTGNEEVW